MYLYINWFTNTYFVLTYTFNIEKYQCVTKKRSIEYFLSRFRTSSHYLAVKHGRYNNITRHESFYENFQFNQIENEYHFLAFSGKNKIYNYIWPTKQKQNHQLNV
jgi:hypothetical protein